MLGSQRFIAAVPNEQIRISRGGGNIFGANQAMKDTVGELGLWRGGATGVAESREQRTQGQQRIPREQRGPSYRVAAQVWVERTGRGQSSVKPLAENTNSSSINHGS